VIKNHEKRRKSGLMSIFNVIAWIDAQQCHWCQDFARLKHSFTISSKWLLSLCSSCIVNICIIQSQMSAAANDDEITYNI